MFDIVNPAVFGAAIAAGLFVGILAALALGRWVGRRAIAQAPSTLPPNIGSLESAVFALLGLLIAFTFSGALTRFDVRRAQAVDEVNAIGTAYLRIDLLPASAQAGLRETFRNYVDARIATYRKLPDIEAAKLELARSQQLQTDIWQQAVEAMRLTGNHPSAALLVLPALNQMFDITSVRIAATQLHPPNIIYEMAAADCLPASCYLSDWDPGPGPYDFTPDVRLFSAFY